VTRTPIAPKSLPCCCLALLAVALCASSRAQQEGSHPVSLTEATLRGPAVASILDMPQETPAQQLGAIFLLLDLNEQDVAQTLWKEFSGESLGNNVKAALVDQFGAARFLKLARREGTSGLVKARDFAKSCLEASAKLHSSPKRLAKLLADLDNESSEVRQAARSDLAVVGDAGAIACLEALSRATSEKLRTELMLALTRMRPGVEPLLLAAIADGRGQFRRDIVELAGYLHLQDAVPWLAAIASGPDNGPSVVAATRAALTKMGLSSPSPEAARNLIRREIRRLESHSIRDTGEAIWWFWHPKTPSPVHPGPGKLVAHSYPVAMIQKLAAHRLASTLISVGNPSEKDQQMALIYYFETEQVVESAEDRDLENLPTRQISETLFRAMQDNQITAAISCSQLLGKRADSAALSSTGRQRSALATALVSPNRLLRYAALEAIMAILPEQTFAGASGVSPALWQFATHSDKEEHNTQQAAVALGWLAALLETGHPYDELLRDANRISLTLYQSDLTAATLRVLAVLGTADSQQLLLDYLSTDTLPIELRQTAGGAFAKSVKRFGKLLTSQEILRQYDRYNASETADRSTQRLLSEVLDLLEK